MGPPPKRKAPEKAAHKSNRVAAAFSQIRQKQKQAENPFDRFSNAKKKHEVVNRRVKGEDRNVGRARGKAVDERKQKLMTDLVKSRKSNTFVDKRFGEGDTNMSVEEKMFLRFQKEKMKKAKNLSLYNLDADENDAILTHKGAALGSAMGDDGDWSGSEDEDDKRLGKDVVDNLHFGGGFVPKAPSAESDNYSSHNKSKAEVLQEIVMKSKLHKMERREAKDAQEAQREDIDKQFEALLAASDVQMNPVGKYSRRNADDRPERDEFADYDEMYGAMQYDSKAQPSDRTKTPEEIALQAREKLQKLEAERLKRMNMDGSMDAGVDLSLAPKDKKRHTNDDEIDEFGDNYGWNNKDDAGSGEDEEDSNELEDSEGDEENSDEEEDSEGAEDEDMDSEDDMDDEDDDEYMSGEEDDDEDGEDSSAEEEFDRQLQELLKKKAQEEGIAPAASSSKSKTPTAKDTKKAVVVKKSSNGDKAVSTDGVNVNMPHSVDCPSDIIEFQELVDQYVVNPATDFKELVNRILVWNSIHLPGHEGAENKPRMHNFLDILVKYFIQIGNDLRDEAPKFTMQELDVVAVSIYKLAQDMPEAATSLFGRTLSMMHSQLEKRLRDYVQGTLKTTCWPSLGQLLLLQSLGSVYSITDFRNSTVVSVTMLLCQCLTQCPVASLQDVSHAVLASSVLLGYTAEVKRLVPEVLTLVSSVLSVYGPTARTTLPKWSKIVNREALFTWVMGSSQKMLLASDEISNKWANFKWEYFSDRAGTRAQGSDVDSVIEKFPNAAIAVFHALAVIVRDCHRRYSGLSSYAEMMIPISSVLNSVVDTVFPEDLKVSLNQLQQNVEDSITSCTTGRKPLAWRGKIVTAIPSLAPRYEVNYSMKKDMDPDQARVKVKQLQRQVKREQKAAMRELRRDADFLGQEVYKAQQSVKDKKRAERNENFAWMEQEQGFVNQQVRKGGEMLRGGGSGATRPIKRVKRSKR